MSQRDSAMNALLMAADRLGVDEILVLAEQADRMVMGEQIHGKMNLNVARDWDREAEEELLDYLVYRSCKRLAKARGRLP